ncbi:DUF3106 domain-containing protein [Aquabacterium sp.]|uniref:DUF3106 domain-containing protein n=1 Tax=Aquabacterium sp. TaxID=1872578 RepID=UPI0037830969
MPRRLILVLPATLFASVAFSLVVGAGALAQSASAPAAARNGKLASSELGGPSWSSLTAAQRQALAPLERDWSGIDGQRKSKWLEIASRYASLPADEQRRLQARMTEWARLTPAERGRARLSFQEAKQLSPHERQTRWEAYQALPEDQRKALAARARRANPERGAERSRLGASAPLAAVPKQTGTNAPARAAVKPVAPTVVQAAPGATTTLMTRSPSPPPHQHPGQPKIVASPTHVDRSTLLPKGGPQAPAAPQAAATGGATASSPHP